MARVSALDIPPLHSRHGMVLGSDEKGLRSAYICIDDGSIDWESSKQAMHSGELDKHGD